MRCVLVIDDSQSCRAAVRLAFESDTTQVIEAVDGEQGLLAAGPHAPDVIVMGMSLAVVHGADLVRGLRIAAPSAQIIVVSSEAVCPHAMEAGADAVVTRPVCATTLRSIARPRTAA
ncbi:MAG: response regulator [Phycisphaerales bacterium]|nr:response regulator [Phycisphaerales bacterium]